MKHRPTPDQPDKSIETSPPDNVDFFLHTEKNHKDWYKAGQMGNLGDKRGFLPKEAKKPKKR